MTKVLDDSTLKEDEKKDFAFQTTVAMRDALNIALKKQQPPTYEQSIRFFHELDPDLYEKISEILTEKNESETVKLYREKARLESLKRGIEVSAEELLLEDINILEQLKHLPDAEKEKTQSINREIAKFHLALAGLRPRHLSENAILNRDATFSKRGNLPSEELFSDYGFKDFKLSRDRYLRVRLLHPDIAEHTTGADLLYEQVDIINKRVKIIFLQYKTWENGVLYFSAHKNLETQISRLSDSVCKCNYCDSPDIDYDPYRFPHCSAFLRPTDKLQFSNSKMISSGLYIPICKVNKIRSDEKKLDKKELKYSALNHHIFEDLFNLGLIGSRWLTVAQAEEFYKKNNIIEKRDTLILHTKEFIDSNIKTVLTKDDYEY